MDIINYIPQGHQNAITRKELSNITHTCDRDTRKAIEFARKDNTICNLSDANGYFIPLHNGDLSARAYVNQEINRIISLLKSTKHAREELNIEMPTEFYENI